MTLKPAFALTVPLQPGIVTTSDGAASVLLMDEKAEAEGLKPCKIPSCRRGKFPEVMGIGPVVAFKSA